MPTKYVHMSPDKKGFTITHLAYKDFITENDLRTKIVHLLGTADHTNKESLERVSSHIKKYIMDGILSKELVKEIFHHYEVLGGMFHNATVAVDTLHQKEPFTVQGEATLLLRLKEVWASLFDVHRLSQYQQNYDSIEAGIGISIQKVKKGKTTTNQIPFISPISHTNAPISHSIANIHTATKVYVILSQSELAVDIAKCYVDGIGMLTGEQTAENIALSAKTFSPRPVLYKIHDIDMLEVELDKVKQVRQGMGCKNLWLILPSVSSVEEVVNIKKHITQAGLLRSPSFKIWMTIDSPSTIILLDKCIEAGVDGISIDPHTLATHMLGREVRNRDMENEAVLWAIEKAIKTAHKYHSTSSIILNTPLAHIVLMEKCIEWGVTSVSVPTGEIASTRTQIAEIEKKLFT